MDGTLKDGFLPGLPEADIRAAFERAPGNEFSSGKFFSKESSAALAANAFGKFLLDAPSLPPLPGCEAYAWPAQTVGLEEEVRFPWRGGHHPCLDVLVELDDALIGVESKRYEPFRAKQEGEFSDAYWRDVWGSGMLGYEAVRDRIRAGALAFKHLDAVQLVKHAFGLRTQVHRQDREGKQPVLYYLYAEPDQWPGCRPVEEGAIRTHREEIDAFAAQVSGDEVAFHAASYAELLESWRQSSLPHVREHASAVLENFRVAWRRWGAAPTD